MSTNTAIKAAEARLGEFGTFLFGGTTMIQGDRAFIAALKEERAELRAALEAAQTAAQQGGGEWQEAQRICDLPAVHEVIQGFADDQTGDNATMAVREVMRAIAAQQGEKK